MCPPDVKPLYMVRATLFINSIVCCDSSFASRECSVRRRFSMG